MWQLRKLKNMLHFNLILDRNVKVVMTVIRRIERFSHQAGKNDICGGPQSFSNYSDRAGAKGG